MLANFSCAVLVDRPVDAAPIRSPQAVHTAILPHLVGKSLVEIGTRNGDGMSCFVRAASSAIAVDRSAAYCGYLRNRSDALRQASGASFSVLCDDYRTAAGLDTDVFTWWQEPPHLHNFAVLSSLRRLMDKGQVRSSADAILVFDYAFHLYRKDWKRLKQLNWTSWTQSVAGQGDEKETGWIRQQKP